MRPLRLAFAAVLASLAVRSAGAQGWIVPRPCPAPLEERRPDDQPRIRPPIDCRPIGQVIVRTRSDVRVELVDRVLRWEVEERFVNRGGMVGEADYVFPLPKGGAFRDLKLSIDGQLVAGETMGAGEARRIYEDIVRRQRDPALVEWMGSGLLRARIFPINPGEEKRVVVRFESVVEREGDAWRVDYARGSRAEGRGSRVLAAEGREPSFVLTYPVSSQLGRPYSPTHELDVAVRDGRYRVEARGGSRDVTLLLPLRRSDAPSITTLANAPGGESGFALVTVAPPAGRTVAATPRDVAFVVDASGSMSGPKIEQAKAAGRQLLSTLRPGDRFRIIDFSTDVRTFRDEPVYATASNVRAAQRYLESLEASGSTNIAGALAEALRDDRDDPPEPWKARPERDDSASDDASGDDVVPARRRALGDRLRLVLFLTDGEPTVGERSPEALARQAARDRHGARLFTFGLGADVNAALLERMALEGGGTAQFVRPDESVERMVSVVASRLVDPVLTDVRVRVEGGDVRLEKMHPSQPLDLFAGQDLLLLARYRGHGRARVVVEGRRGGERVRWTSDADFPERERGNPFVARLWAVQRIGYLSAERRQHGGTPELDDEIRTLGERFGIPTEFTAYLVVEPGMVARRQLPADANMRGTAGGVASAPSAPAPMAAREQRFESAKAAAEQRAARSLADVDSMGASPTGGAQRVVGERTFVERDGRWTDTRFRTGTRTVKIKAFSAAYFALLDRLPELAKPLALGDRVIVSGARVAVEIADDGAKELDEGALRQLVADWR